jgi:peptidoglycan/LPS O-acetylase OafA/YrhL
MTTMAAYTKNSDIKGSYRPEINGLRALAVVAVIINHFNKDILPSGYLGVDIFFVISGFVITSSMAGRSSRNFGDLLMGFYVRRIKRLVPALVVFVVITSFLICMFNPNPGTYLQTGMTSLFGLSNLFLLKNSIDYFATSTELNPFTHTWSLGVEEQFYFLFPFLLWFTGFGRQTSKGSRKLIWVIGTLSVASLIVFIYLYQKNQPEAYFSMPTRLWEMGTGCLLFLGMKQSNRLRSFLQSIPPLLITAGILGVLFIPLQFAVSATVALVVLTAVLIASLRSGTTIYDLFTHQWVVYIGLISYSLYLWHWGVLCISRWTIGIHWWSVPLQVALMLLLSIVSYRYVETPLRRSDWAILRWQTIGKGIGASFCAIGIVLTTNFFRDKLYQGGETAYRDNRLYQSLVSICHQNCSKNIFIVGDSHAGHLGALFEMLNSKDRFSVYLHARGNGIRDISESGNFITPVLKAYNSKILPGDIIVISTFGISKEILGEYKDAISFATSLGASVVIFNPTPYFSEIVPYSQCNIAWYRPSFSIPKECTAQASRSKLEYEMKSTNEFISGLNSGNDNVFVFDAFSILCPNKERFCSSVRNGRSLYKDKDHLSSYGAEMLYADFTSFLRRHDLLRGKK